MRFYFSYNDTHFINFKEFVDADTIEDARLVFQDRLDEICDEIHGEIYENMTTAIGISPGGNEF